MCGIVAYIGKNNGLKSVIHGIEKIDYRGYDSTGVSLIKEDGSLYIEKQKGAIDNLKKLIPQKLTGKNIIAHTRWATHGVPNKTNAHPHYSDDKKIALVHNGVIENYQHLKALLEEKGYRFYSQTDTEVLVKLISYFYSKNCSFKDAVRRALKRVEGTYGIATICTDEPNKIIVARLSSPIIIGFCNDETFIASDISALICHTNNVIYLKDYQLAEIEAKSYNIVNLQGESMDEEIICVDWDIPAIGKDGYPHFMLKEIFEQPTTVKNAFLGRINRENKSIVFGGLNLSLKQIRDVKYIKFVACGTSWHAALVGKYLIESIARIPVVVEYASEFRYKNPIFPEKTIVFTLSQSGETADTLAALRITKERGVPVFGITNVVGSTIARESNSGIYIHAGAEIGVASTKAFTSQVMIMAMLTILLAKVYSQIDDRYIDKFFDELDIISEKIKKVFLLEEQIKTIAKMIKNDRNALFLGRDVNFPVALEGALKLKEISYIHAEGYPAAEMKHGPIALIDKQMPSFIVAPYDKIYEKTFSNLSEIKARDGRVYVIATKKDKNLEKLAQEVLYIPTTIRLFSPILSVIPLQLLAYHVALNRGLNIDKPRNLAKSVTVE